MNTRAFFSVALMAVSAVACRENPKAAPPPPVPSSLPAKAPSSPSVEVLIVTQPEEARILAEGQVLGKTPMKIKIREDTNLVLEKEKFVRQAILLTPQSNPNIVVELVPVGENPSSSGASLERKAKKKRKANHLRADRKISNAMKEAGAESPEDETKTGPERAIRKRAPAPTPPPRPELDTMRKCKDAYNDGLITRADYQEAVREIRRRLREDISALKTRYQSGEITRAQYRRQARDIKLRYEG